MSDLGTSYPKPFERVMGFIDGGYLRELCKKHGKTANVHFGLLYATLIVRFNSMPLNPFQANLIRIYYYDAIVDETHADYNAQRKYFEAIPTKLPYTVRLGKLVESANKGFKQKGVDILMSVDAITKAYTNQYDVGIFLIGDRDFMPMVEAVKDAGKKTMCMYYPANSSRDLIRTFDFKCVLDEKSIRTLVKTKQSNS